MRNPCLPTRGYAHEAISKPKLRPAPKLVNPGAQLGKDKNGYFVREVLDGFPAGVAGLKKKDRIGKAPYQICNNFR